MELSRSLIPSYGGPAPRYTSYPPANHFKEEPQLLSALHAFFQQPDNLVLPYSLYLHFPYCTELCFFCGCNMEITNSGDKRQTYIDHLLKDINVWADMVGSKLPVAEIHFGGGSPSDISGSQMDQVLDVLRQRFQMLPSLRQSIEVDPRNVHNQAQVKRMVASGFNRISLGVQDFEPVVQAAINRIQPTKKTFDTYRWFRAAGVGSINIDLIYGLPLQTLASFKQTLAKVLDLEPDRIALFQFAYLPKLKKHHRMIKEEQLPGAELRMQLFELALKTLLASGYVYLGMDHFAKPSDPLAKAAEAKTMGRNFQGYHEGVSRHMIGFGMSSIGVLDHIYFQNTKDIALYQQSVTAGKLPVERGYLMSQDDLMRSTIIERLMCDFALDYDAVSAEFRIVFADYFHTEISELIAMQEDGLISFTAEGFEVTPQGKHFIRYIAKVFDAYARAGKLGAHHMKVV